MTAPRITYYADDFTGATDALEQLEAAGVRTVLFLAPPNPSQLAGAGFPEAVGVAGYSRSLGVNQLAEVVAPALEALRDLGPQHVHYKVCSTFDSSPDVGSIGRVIDLAAELFPRGFIPVVVGSPLLGRWVAFGNLFAGVGIGADSDVYRLDRHPAMTQHPVTPADEADLRRVLARQTSRRIGFVDMRALTSGLNSVVDSVERQLDDGAEVVVFDTLTAEHLTTIGDVLERFVDTTSPLFSVGSSAIETALTARLPRTAMGPTPLRDDDRPALVLAGSCSPVTCEQLKCGYAAGAVDLRLDPNHLEAQAAGDRVIDALRRGAIAIISTGQTDSRKSDLEPAQLGAAFALILRHCRDILGDRPVLIAGGDTASYTVRTLGAEAILFDRPFIPGAPICRLAASDRTADGLRVVLKGGQVGRPDLITSFLTN